MMKYTLTFAALAALAAPAYAQNAAAGTRGQQPAASAGIGASSTVTTTRGEIPGVVPGHERSADVQGRPAVNDALFAAAAAEGGLSELTISQLGAQRGTDPELRRFSERMLEEHTLINNELKTIAARKGIAVPQRLDVRSAFCAESLHGLSGEEFDRCYARAQLIVHLDALAAFESEAERGLDPDVKAMAARTVPRIKSHLEMIRPIAKKYMWEKENVSREHGINESNNLNQSGNVLGRPGR